MPTLPPARITRRGLAPPGDRARSGPSLRWSLRYSALLSLYAAVLLSGSAGAAPLQDTVDTVETVEGQTLTGTIGRSSFLVETEAGERLEIPRKSIRRMIFDGDQVDVQLTEGDGLHGRLLDDEIHVHLDLFDRVLNADDVRSITFARPGTLLPAGTEVDLRYALLAGDRQIADRRERGVEVEERKTNTARTKISLSAAQLDLLQTEGPALLRLSMTVEDD